MKARPALLAGALAALLAGCSALAWLAEPVGGPPPAAQAAPGALEPPCQCRAPGAAGEPLGPAPAAPTRLAVLTGAAAKVGGLLTGAPVAWTLGGQLAHLLLGTAASAVRRRRERSA